MLRAILSGMSNGKMSGSILNYLVDVHNQRPMLIEILFISGFLFFWYQLLIRISILIFDSWEGIWPYGDTVVQIIEASFWSAVLMMAIFYVNRWDKERREKNNTPG